MTITLKTLPQATEQEVFDQVAAHLLTQRQKSQISSGDCAYLAPNGLKCAAGCLIGEEEYDPGFETWGWHSLVKKGLVPNEHKWFILDLQALHDSCPVENWEVELAVFAKKRGLSFSLGETP